MIEAGHLDSLGHPATFAANPNKYTGASAATTVSGAVSDVDTTGAKRLIVGATGAEHSIQDNANLKLSYDLTPTLKLNYTLGYWQNNSTVSVNSYLRDAAGNPVYTGIVSIDGQKYNLANAFQPSKKQQEHLLNALSFKTSTDGSWDWQGNISIYDFSKDRQRSATAGLTGAGTITDLSGTGWQTVDIKGDWRPGGSLASTPAALWLPLRPLRAEQPQLCHQRLAVRHAGQPDRRLCRQYPDSRPVCPGYLAAATRRAADCRWPLRVVVCLWWGHHQRPEHLPRPGAQPAVLLAQGRGGVRPERQMVAAHRLWPRLPHPDRGRAVPGFGAQQQYHRQQPQPESRAGGYRRSHRHAPAARRHPALTAFREQVSDALLSQTNTTVTPNVTNIQNIDRVVTNGLEVASSKPTSACAGWISAATSLMPNRKSAPTAITRPRWATPSPASRAGVPRQC
jgi:iron complex outermembrane receptor protein